ncbi:PTS ascorbate transporter subunit IIC [Sporolactobacillus sp. KGMB 08714]|uniref:PTS ascorbate transporter subunit IIC n=1 Tax=Sporolactobacillus sp. KGMB 08714 TaxID=3064704 RepID=UPI002FBD6039
MGLLRDLFGQPAIVAGLIVCMGLIALKKPITEIIRGSVRATIGFVTLLMGTNIIVAALSNFGKVFSKAFSMQGVIPSNEAAISIVLSKYGSIATLIFVFGMILNILLARITRFKYIFLSTDHALYMSCALTAVMVASGMNLTESIVFGALMLGMILCIMPAVAHPTMKLITGKDDMSFAHFGTFGYWFCAQIGKIFGKNSRSIEEINFPKQLEFLQDSNVSVGIIMTILFYVITIIAGPEYVSTLSGGVNPYVWALLQALQFTAGILILVTGVNILLDEINPAFKGFSSRIVPNAVPGYPFAILFRGTSNALLVGFLMSLLGGLLGMTAQFMMGTVIILPGIVFHFFCGGIGAIFGNATGGRRGAIIGPFLTGIIMTFLPLLFINLFGGVGFTTTTFSDSDFLTFSVILGTIGRIGATPLMITISVLLVLMILVSIKKKSNVQPHAES